MALGTVNPATRVRVNLERLLRCSEKLGNELSGESDRRRLLTYLSVLERYWHELDAARCSKAVLDEYRRKIEHIGDLLDDEKMLAGSGGALARSQAHNNASLTREQANSELASRLNAASRVQQALRSQLMQHVEGVATSGDASSHASCAAVDALPAMCAGSMPGCSSVGAATAAAATAAAASSLFLEPGAAERAALVGAMGGAGSGSGGGGNGGGDGSAEPEGLGRTLETQRELQDDLLEDLGELVAQMKDKSLQAREAVKDDTAVLDATGNVIDLNQAKLDASNEALKQQINAMRGSTCITWLMLLLVCLIFVFMFFFMKLFKKKV